MVKEVVLQLQEESPANDEKGYVPAFYYSIFSKQYNCIVGRCVLRVGHNENTFYGGNIGYFVNEEFRGHRFAYYACLELFNLASEKGLSYVIITCNPQNTPSKKTCELLDGIFLGEYSIPATNEMILKGECSKLIYKYYI